MKNEELDACVDPSDAHQLQIRAEEVALQAFIMREAWLRHGNGWCGVEEVRHRHDELCTAMAKLIEAWD